jgi:predicted O-linked N-acetylglucosamine transferase (SPINDLY family)
LAEAEAALREAIRREPAFSQAYCNLGLVLSDQDRADQAIPCFQQALKVDPQDALAARGLGYALGEAGWTDESLLAYQRACRLDPTPASRVCYATQLPLVYRSVEDIHRWRARLAGEVARLIAEGVTISLANERPIPVFGLAYQGFNDRDLQRELARLYRPPEDRAFAPASAGGRIRVGFISHFFSKHTIGRLMRGIIAGLSRRDFAVTVLSTRRHDDPVGQFIREHAEEYLELPPDLPAARQALRDQRLDVLVYCDIGMDSFTHALAFSRLAPVQCVTWGHPLTTGLASIDYFLSGALLEIDAAQSHYSEELVRMDSLTFCYDRPRPPRRLSDRAAFGLSQRAHLYLCPQSIYKLHPEFDPILAEILRRDPQGQVALIRWAYPRGDELLRERFQALMPDVAGRIHFLRRFQQDEFLDLLAVADVILDPPHFGGGMTTTEALGQGVPVVTLPSQFLRGRITAAMYRRMGVPDCVAGSPQQYAEIAVQLGTEPDFRRQVCGKIRAADGLLFENPEAIREWESFLQRAVARWRAGDQATRSPLPPAVPAGPGEG